MTFETIKLVLSHWFRVIILRGYGWQPRTTNRLGKPLLQWRDPRSNVWVFEKAAMKLLTVQVMDEYQRR